MNVLLLEDDKLLNTTFESFLQFKKYQVTPLFDGEKAIEYINTVKYDLYIIDVNLPNINGLEIVKYIRNKDLSTPIIMITGSIEVDNFRTAFKNGCNEYIKKPFHLDELEIRINNLLKQQTTQIISITPNITYDLDYEELTIDNQTIQLRKKERRLLSILLQNINHTVNYDVIENYVWENDIRERYPLRQLVSELKKPFYNYPNIIQTNRGKGYKLIMEID